MSTNVDCPICNQTIEVPERYVGKNWRCPACRTRIIPRPGSETVPISGRIPKALRAVPGSGATLARPIEWLIAAAVGALVCYVALRVFG